MPRQARLDAPGTVHHVILRGLDRGQIVADVQDREVFLARVGELAATTGTTVYAWALLPNHAHLLLRSAPRGLPQFMRRLLTGFALACNRLHKRVGHSGIGLTMDVYAKVTGRMMLAQEQGARFEALAAGALPAPHLVEPTMNSDANTATEPGHTPVKNSDPESAA